MRHLHWLFEALGRPYDKPNRTQIDLALRGLLGLDEARTCYEVWAAIKALPAEEMAMLPVRVSEVLGTATPAPTAIAPAPPATIEPAVPEPVAVGVASS